MHAANLGLQYALGVSDNYSRDRLTGVRHITTPGSNGEPFTEATAAISKIRSIVKYFGTPERRNRLKAYAEEHSYVIPGIDGETRTAGIPTRFCLFEGFFTEACVAGDQDLFTCVSENEWKQL